ncbi:MAG: hypothetical protein AB7G23_00800 [Vicinamibacterales bacterium]
MRAWSAGAEQTLALALLIPALAGALGLLGLEAIRVARPGSALFATPTPSTFAEALHVGGVDAAFRFVRAGADPNRPVLFTDERLTAGRTVRVPPLLLAVAAGDENTAMMLVGYGADLTRPGNAQAICLARALGADGLADDLVAALGPRQTGADIADPCATAAADPAGAPEPGAPPPLLRYVDAVSVPAVP